jgi:hypothetical protein
MHAYLKYILCIEKVFLYFELFVNDFYFLFLKKKVVLKPTPNETDIVLGGGICLSF